MVRDGQSISVNAYIHNNAHSKHNGDLFDGPAVATGARLSLRESYTDSGDLILRAWVGADNAWTVTDSVVLRPSEGGRVELKSSNPPVMFRRAGELVLKHSEVFSQTGAPLTAVDGFGEGIFPGCYDFQSMVQLVFAIKIVDP